MFRYFSGLMVIVLGGLNALPVTAQDVTSARQFGAGVHEFYRGRYFEAVRYFDTALAHDSRDPRAYFFRGLAKQRLGWTGDAEVDFRLGAQLEVALKRRDVGLALQRIQGPDRLLLERFRSEARRLPEAIVRHVIPQPAVTPVQPSIVRQQPPATRARYVPGELAADTTDPFDEQAQGLLGRGELQASARQPVVGAPTSPAGDDPFNEDFARDAPFGSGVAGEAPADDAPDDPFASEGAEAGQRDEPSGGITGAILRAFSRSVAPAAEGLAEQGGRLLDDARGVAPDDAAADSAPQDDVTDVEADDPFDFESSDEDVSTDQDESAEPAEGADDPFADDDPFDF